MRLDGAICRMFADRAARLADAVRALSYDEARGAVAVAVQRRAGRTQLRTLSARSTCAPRVDAGGAGLRGHPVQQNLAPQVMTMEQLDYLQEHLRILSGSTAWCARLDGVGAVPPGNAGEARGGRRAQSLRVLGRQPEPRAREPNTDVHREPGIVWNTRRAVVPSGGSLRGQECSPACWPPSTRAIASCSAPPPRKRRARYHGGRWCAENAIKDLPTCKPSMRSATRSIPLGRPDDCYVFVQNSHA